MPFVCHELHPTPFDVPRRWKPQRELMLRALRVAFADFSAAPWQGLEKSERCPNNSSLFRPQAAVVVVAVQVLAGPQSGIRHHLTFLCAGTRALSNSPLGCCLPRPWRCRAVQVLAGPQSGIRHHLTFLCAGTRRLSKAPPGLYLRRFASPPCSSPDWQQKRAPIRVLFFVMGQPGLEPGTKRL